MALNSAKRRGARKRSPPMAPKQDAVERRPTFVKALAHAVVRIAKVNSTIDRLSEHLKEIDSTSPGNQPTTGRRAHIDGTDDVSALLDAFDLDSPRSRLNVNGDLKGLMCPAELRERARLMVRIRQLGQTTRMFLQQKYPSCWQQLLET